MEEPGLSQKPWLALCLPHRPQDLGRLLDLRAPSLPKDWAVPTLQGGVGIK